MRLLIFSRLLCLAFNFFLILYFYLKYFSKKLTDYESIYYLTNLETTLFILLFISMVFNYVNFGKISIFLWVSKEEFEKSQKENKNKFKK